MTIEQVPLPTHVTISVKQLTQLWQDYAMLMALQMAGVDSWSGYEQAQELFETDETIRDIKLGEY